jgi:hypothetical protein
MSKSTLFYRPTLYVIMAMYVAFTFAVLAMGDLVVAATIPEDRFFELLTSLALLVTAGLFFYGFLVARKLAEQTRITRIKQFVYLALALLFFFGAGEEISWGQRILGFETPEPIAQVNKQEEFNAHNLAAWQDLDFLNANTLFDAFWFLFAVFTPAVAVVAPSFKQFADRYIPIVYWGLGLLFLYNYLWAKAAKIVYQTAYTFERISLTQAVQEIKESNYAVIFVLVGLFAVLDLDSSK